jgi:hypothetical protein
MENPTLQNSAPVSTKDWLVTLIIAAIPVVGFIMLFVWAFGAGTDLNKANWAKAGLLFIAISIAFGIVLTIIFGAGLFAIFNGADSY